MAMIPPEVLFGSDLRLLGDLERQNDRDRGSDLFVTARPQNAGMDLETLRGVESLQQALLLRFLTPAGELTILGHADYGSRLHELIGELNNQTNRNRIRMMVLQAVAQEPRVQQVLALNVTQGAADRTAVNVSMTLKVIDSPNPLNLVFDFSLAGGAGGRVA